MVRDANYTRPIYLAWKVLTESNVETFPVSLKLILRHYGIRLMSYDKFCQMHDCPIEECYRLFGKDGATIFEEGNNMIKKQLLGFFVACLIFPFAFAQSEPIGSSEEVALDANHFPDAAFCSYVSVCFDLNNDNSLSHEEIEAITDINIDPEAGEISSVKGIEYFYNLESLVIGFQPTLLALDVSCNAKLNRLECIQCSVSTIDIRNCPLLMALISNVEKQLFSGDGLAYYYVDSDNKSGLFFDTSTLIITTSAEIEINEANFPDAKFRSFVTDFDSDGSGTLSDEEINGVKWINCDSKSISDLTGIEFFAAMTNLNCGDNLLTNLDLSLNNALEWLYCPDNQLVELKLGSKPALRFLRCDNNNLTAINVSNCPVLYDLICSGNKLTSLDVSNNTILWQLFCDNNDLSTLTLGRHSISYGGQNLHGIHCQNNKLSSIDISECDLICEVISAPDAFHSNANNIWWKCETDDGAQGLHVDSGVQITTKQEIITARIPDLNKTLHIPEDTESIEDMAFENIAAEIIFIPNSVKNIGSRAFANNPQLLAIFFPNKNVNIESDAFAGSMPTEFWDYEIEEWAPDSISISTHWW